MGTITIDTSKKTPQVILVQKPLIICGIISSILYVAMNIVVAMLYEGYNSASQAVSELSAIDAPTRPLWVFLGIIYTLLVAAFGWGVWMSAGSNRYLRTAGSLLMLYGIIGLGWPLAPMHQREVLAAGGGDLSDTLHIVFSMVSVLLMIGSMIYGGMSFGKPFRLYSIVTVILIIFLGILTGLDAPEMEANLPTPWLGIVERIMIGLFLLWIVVFAMKVLRLYKDNTQMQK